MAGNGYFANGIYQTKSTETWADLTNGWDTYSSWALSPSLPLTFTTAIQDYGRIEKVLPITQLAKQGQLTTTIEYGNTIDSSGGDIDSATSVVYNNGDTVQPITARYFRFTFSLNYLDSAGAEPTPFIGNITTDLNAEKQMATFDSIDSSTLPGSTGQRQLSLTQPISPTVVTVTPHLPISDYVLTGYVADGYVSGASLSRPIIYLNKASDPIVLNIFELDTYGKNKNIDCTFDAIVSGLPTALVDADGNIQKG
tara:strand:- start:597 stop:1358 length:762 start_codon:yes stop_codon:yes gene_type:complete